MNKIIIFYLAVIFLVVTSSIYILNNFSQADMKPVVIYSDDKGKVVLTKWYYYPKGGKPGDEVTVRAYIYNGRTEPIKLYVESGIAPKTWKYFSIYGTPVPAELEGGPCCPQNENYDGGYITIEPGDYVYVTLHPHIPTEDSVDHCHNLGSFWDGENKDYKIAFIVVQPNPQTGDACWHSPTNHGISLYSSQAFIYVGKGGVDFFGYYLDTTNLIVILLLVLGILSTLIVELFMKR